MFRQGLDEYKAFSSESLHRVPYDQVTKEQRQIAKSAVLGCLFGQGAKGLAKYAQGMGVVMNEVQAQTAVNSYRKSYSQVRACWNHMENAAMDAIDNPGKIVSIYNKPQDVETKDWVKPLTNIKFQIKKDALWMTLPSGRKICWQSPQIEEKLTPWQENRNVITIRSQNTFTRQWGRNDLIGSSIFQSAVQGCARDFLAEAMLRLYDKGYNVCNLVHDEVLLLVEEQSAESALEDVINIMTTPPTWAPDFPLAAEGWIAKRYRK
jgi:DNA polymerase